MRNKVAARARDERRLFLRLAWSFCLPAIAVHPTARALAEDVMGALREPTASVLTTPRDPKEFLDDLQVVLPRPTILLSRRDAVATELLRYTRTMSTQDTLRTAQALCDEAAGVGYDPLLFLAVIHIESYYDHLAISPVGAEGLMQLMPPTAEWMAARLQLPWNDNHSFDPVLNVRLGVRYLADLHRQFRRMDYALTAYNRGPSATRYIVARHGGLPNDIHEFYSAKVLTYYDRLRAQYGHLPAG